LPLATAPLLRPLTLAAAETPTAPTAASATFDAATVRGLARELAAKPYEAPSGKLPDALAKLTYDQYREIRFDPTRALWHGKGLRFEVQLFHRGFLYTDRVELYEVTGGRAAPIRYSADMFELGTLPRPPDEDLGFAGFRILSPLNRADKFDEVCAFLGASYFRAVAKGQFYGLSARGLAIKTADSGGEEFPVFRAFWIERPQPRTGAIVVHALLDGPSAAGAFRFTIRPGEETVFDVESAIYPRVDIAQIGLAPLTSMFYYGPSSRSGVDDYRPAVHDSDGLALLTGWREQLWRPLTNPVELQISTFSDVNPRGFGLMQRRRDFAAYQDLEARYERRPSLWVEPIGDAGEGAVHLVEIPTKGEIHDNIVAFWRPTAKLDGKGEYLFDYRLRWCADHASGGDLAKIVETRSGAGSAEKTRLFVIDFAGKRLTALPAAAKPTAEVISDKGKIADVVAQANQASGGWRVTFQLAPEGEATVEMHARLLVGDAAVSESWVYRWTR
jgi:glucans biosynthesis protein